MLVTFSQSCTGAVEEGRTRQGCGQCSGLVAAMLVFPRGCLCTPRCSCTPQGACAPPTYAHPLQDACPLGWSPVHGEEREALPQAEKWGPHLHHMGRVLWRVGFCTPGCPPPIGAPRSPVIPTQGCPPPTSLCHPPLGHPLSPCPGAGCHHPLRVPSPQDDYRKLLTKYAEAENTIDQLRLGARVGAGAGRAAGGAPRSAPPSPGLFGVSSSPGPALPPPLALLFLLPGSCG